MLREGEYFPHVVYTFREDNAMHDDYDSEEHRAEWWEGIDLKGLSGLIEATVREERSKGRGRVWVEERKVEKNWRVSTSQG